MLSVPRMIAIMEAIPRAKAEASHRGSWAASWLHLDSFLPGCYALSVTGQLPEEALENLSRNGRVVNRDRSKIASK